VDEAFIAVVRAIRRYQKVGQRVHRSTTFAAFSATGSSSRIWRSSVISIGTGLMNN
jgi:hypothetical protein